jgi:hypothetical protein
MCGPEHDNVRIGLRLLPSIHMTNTRKIALLTHVTKQHGIPRKCTVEAAENFCKEVGIEIIQLLPMKRGFSVLVDEIQAGEAILAWKRRAAEELAKGSEALRPDENTRFDRLEDRMIAQEHALDILVKAQNIVAERLKILLTQLGVVVESPKNPTPDAS